MRLIGLVLLTQSLLLAPLAAHAQQAGKIYRVGHLATAEFEQPDPTEQRAWPTFIEALKSLGWIEGKNFVFVFHSRSCCWRIRSWSEALDAGAAGDRRYEKPDPGHQLEQLLEKV